MFVSASYSPASRKVTNRSYLLSSFIALMFALAINPNKAQAQIIDDVRVNVPFQFHAGNAKLPAGEYRIHVLDGSDPTILEISSADGTISALFQVEDTDANSTPAKSELIFNKYGNGYFLAQLFEQGNSSGSKVLESQYEKRTSHETMEAQEHVAAHTGRQQGE